MVLPYPFDDPHRGDRTDYPQAPQQSGDPADFRPVSYGSNEFDYEQSHVIRLRMAPWDVVATITLLALLLALATVTTWPTKLFGFLAYVCTEDTCGPVPFGIDMYIYPVVWGGIGAAIAAAGIGPFVSLLKGWYMSFWPVLSLTILMVSSVAGSMITIFSARYWH